MSRAQDQLDVALLVGAALERAGARWMIGGSIATSAYGEPRATHDVDLAADLRIEGVEPFVRGLGEGFYADTDTIADACRRRGSFNVIHYASVEKVDVFCIGDGTFAVAGLAGRTEWDLGGGRTAPVARPEYMVVEKLRWYRRGGEVSDRQLRDVQGVLQVVGPSLDLALIREWATEVGVADLLATALADAGLPPG